LFNLSGGWAYGEIYAGGRHLATYSVGTTNFLHTDWLGSRRVATGLTGAPTDTCTGLPFGDGINCVGTEWNFNRFTDYVHDSESNLEHSLFRQYSSTQGRYLTPDPYLASMDLANPQSINRYPYVIGNPVNFTDSLGLDLDDDPDACTLLNGTEGEIFACPGGWAAGGKNGGLLGKILGALNGSGLAGSSVPGTCFLPGACPSLPIPSIWDFLPKMPQQGCDPGPCPQPAIPGINGLQSAGSVAVKAGAGICAANAEICLPVLTAGAGIGVVVGLGIIDYLLIKDLINSGRQAACRYPRLVPQYDVCEYICDDGEVWFDSSCEAVVYKPYGPGPH